MKKKFADNEKAHNAAMKEMEDDQKKRSEEMKAQMKN